MQTWQKLVIAACPLLLTACTTTGRLDYITNDGEYKSVCETEYAGAPSVDKYAVEYVLAYCARKVVAKGHQVVDKYLLTLDLTIPEPPDGKGWSFEYATDLYNAGQLTAKQYGYIIAYIDLGLSTQEQ